MMLVNPYIFGDGVFATPQVRAGISSYSSTASTTLNVALPAGIQPGDLIMVTVSSPSTQLPGIPAGWTHMGATQGASDSGVGRDSAQRLFCRVADGTEGTNLVLTAGAAITFGAVAIVIQRNTYTMPRGMSILQPSLGAMAGSGIGAGETFYSNSIIKHRPFYPYWGGRNSLLLSILARKQSNEDPVANPYTEFQYVVNSDLTTVPDARICGTKTDSPPGVLPVLPNDYSKISYTSAAAMNLAIRGNFVADRPECIFMQTTQTAGAATTTSLAIPTPVDLHAPVVGDLQLLVITMYGAGAVTITPPAGFTLVQKFGQRLAVYKRVVTGSESYPESIGFSSALNVIARIYAFPQGTYDPSTDILSATGTGSTTTGGTPAVVGDASWNGKKNYALRVLVRDGVGGVESNSINTYPAGVPENRADYFTIGNAGSAVSFTIAGGVVQANTAPAENFVFKAAYAYEAMTIFVKGI